MTGLRSVNEGEPVKPITDPRGREQQPDVAALEELRKAFGVVPAGAGTTDARRSAEPDEQLEPTAPTPSVSVIDDEPTHVTAGDPAVATVPAVDGQAEVEPPEVEQVALDEPEVDEPDVEQPELDEPEVDESEVEQPEVMVPEPEQAQPEQAELDPAKPEPAASEP